MSGAVRSWAKLPRTVSEKGYLHLLKKHCPQRRVRVRTTRGKVNGP